MTSDIAPIRVLIIDDDEEDFLITSEYIKKIRNRQFIIDWCYKYKDAFDHIRSADYDIYFIDYYLGVKTGLDLLKDALQQQCEKPLVLLTGMGNQKIDIEAMEAGAFDYLVKLELNTEKLERCIRYSLDRAATLKALKTNERKFRSIFERSKDAVFLTDENLVFKDMNIITSELSGYDKEELMQLSLYQLLANQQEASLIKEQLRLNGNVEDKELELLARNGKKIYGILSVSRERDVDNNIYIQGIIHDITNLKRAEKATLQAEKLGAANRLVRTLAHEVRNPLNNISLSIEQLFAETNEEEGQKVYLDIIQRNSTRINDLITELLDSSYPLESVLEKNALQAILDDCMATIIDRITLKKINWKLVYPNEDAYIMADAAKLKIAFTNIIINAIEAMKEETGELDISVTSENTHHLVSIKDNGTGINSESLPHLFEPYFTSKRNGLGLGLATTLNIIQLHKATIDVLTNTESGSNFILKFARA
jgi:PAS domain S-box-containing protein